MLLLKSQSLPSHHLARFVGESIAQLDLAALYAKYGARGGKPYAPEILLGLLLYGGVFRSRQIERATYEAVAFRFLAGNLHPDHDTLAANRAHIFGRTEGSLRTGAFARARGGCAEARHD